MSISILPRIGELIREQRDVLLARWRRQVRQLPSAKHLDVPALNDHVPRLIDELADALESQSDEAIEDATLDGTPPIHGRQRLHDGFDIAEIVAEYNVLRASIHDLAEENGIVVHGNDLRVLNVVLDEAIGLAVQTYATELALELKQRREEHLSFVAHDLRAPLQAIALTANAIERMIPQEARNQHTEQLLNILRRNIKLLEQLVANVIKENAAIPTEAAEKLERRVIDLWPLVEDAINRFEPVATTASVQMINSVPGDVIVFADAALLTRVFQNLVAHAIECAPRGTVLVEAEEGAKDGIIECRVSHNGPGLSNDLTAEPHISGNAVATSEDRLGVAAAQQFIEAHGGTLHCESLDGAGTTYRFTLPATPKRK